MATSPQIRYIFDPTKTYLTIDTVMAHLPSEVGSILRENIAVIKIVSIFSIGAYNALETVFITFDVVKNYHSLYFWSM